MMSLGPLLRTLLVLHTHTHTFTGSTRTYHYLPSILVTDTHSPLNRLHVVKERAEATGTLKDHGPKTPVVH